MMGTQATPGSRLTARSRQRSRAGRDEAPLRGKGKRRLGCHILTAIAGDYVQDFVASTILARVDGLTLVTAAERAELTDEMPRLGASPWPELLSHDAVVNALWHSIYELAPDFQFGLLDAQTGSLAAVGNCVPIRWDGSTETLPDRGIDAVLEDGIGCLREGTRATAASALMIVVSPERHGQGLSATAIHAMAEVVGRHGLADLVAPVRPTDKQRYPLTPMERYIDWRRGDGSAFDPWIRVPRASGRQDPRRRFGSDARNRRYRGLGGAGPK